MMNSSMTQRMMPLGLYENYKKTLKRLLNL